MFWLTAIVAIEALIIRFWLDSAAALSSRELVGFEGDDRRLELIWLLVLAIANPAVVALVFRKTESSAVWLFALGLTAFVGGTIASVVSGLPGSVSGSFFVAWWLVFHFALVTAALVLFRHRRYRLIRLPLPKVQDTVASAVEGK